MHHSGLFVVPCYIQDAVKTVQAGKHTFLLNVGMYRVIFCIRKSTLPMGGINRSTALMDNDQLDQWLVSEHQLN